MVEGVDDDFGIQFNAQQIILKNLTLKEVMMNGALSCTYLFLDSLE